MTTAYALVSGGLDSGLAALTISRQNIKTVCIIFESLFFDAAAGKALCRHIGLDYRVVDFTDEHLEIVRNPPSGYGKNMNPCIDCHSLMLRLAGSLLDIEDDDFLVTGEVLNQRPMSQNRTSLQKVADGSSWSARILRPLSAKLLEPTEMELKGVVNREELHAIEGRSRKKQLALAKEYGLIEFPSPAGGCTLTDPGFSIKLKDLFDHDPDCTIPEIKQLFNGRHIRTPLDSKLIIARNAGECEKMESDLFNENDLLVTPFELPGPSALIPGVMKPTVTSEHRDRVISESVRIMARYLKNEVTHVETFMKKNKNMEFFKKIPVVNRAEPEELEKLLLVK